jgi:transcriptional regulator with XRE-family HTH domain
MVNYRRIRALRKELKMTQQDLAEKSNITQCYISKIEAGEFEPSIARLKRIAMALGTDITELIK